MHDSILFFILQEPFTKKKITGRIERQNKLKNLKTLPVHIHPLN